MGRGLLKNVPLVKRCFVLRQKIERSPRTDTSAIELTTSHAGGIQAKHPELPSFWISRAAASSQRTVLLRHQDDWRSTLRHGSAELICFST